MTALSQNFLLNDISLETGKPLVHAGVSEFRGQVMTILPCETACLRCIMGDNVTEPEVKGVVSPAVSVIGSIESMEILKLILGEGELLTNKILSYNGLRTNFKTLNISKNPNCKCQN